MKNSLISRQDTLPDTPQELEGQTSIFAAC
jgi:hypothetical protein